METFRGGIWGAQNLMADSSLTYQELLFSGLVVGAGSTTNDFKFHKCQLISINFPICDYGNNESTYRSVGKINEMWEQQKVCWCCIRSHLERRFCQHWKTILRGASLSALVMRTMGRVLYVLFNSWGMKFLLPTPRVLKIYFYNMKVLCRMLN